MFVLDSHCDTPSMLMRGRNIGIDNLRGHVDFPKMKAGGVDASFFALYTNQKTAPDAATRYVLQMIGAVNDAIALNRTQVALARTPAEALENKSKGLMSIFLGMENGLPIQNSLSLLRVFYSLGVRYMTLTHNGDNQIADSASEGCHWNGLSPFGREVVTEMNRLGMIIDLAHASDKTFFDCIECSAAPVVSTHSCCRALAAHRRNMTDEMIRAMADKGGVLQINFYPVFLSGKFSEELERSGLGEKDWIESEWIADPLNKEKADAWNAVLDEYARLKRPSVKAVADHIDHAVKVGGIEHVGIGTDFDGIEVTPEGLENISKLPVLFDELKSRGYSDGDIEKIAGGNFLRVFNDVLSLRA